MIGIFALVYAAVYGGMAFLVIYFAVRLAIRHERRNLWVQQRRNSLAFRVHPRARSAASQLFAARVSRSAVFTALVIVIAEPGDEVRHGVDGLRYRDADERIRHVIPCGEKLRGPRTTLT